MYEPSRRRISAAVFPQTVKSQVSATSEQKSEPAPLKVEQNKVTLSEEGKALLAALKEIEDGKHQTSRIKAWVIKWNPLPMALSVWVTQMT